ncbi:MAG: hypothetical protein R3C49_17155 [Planctomycetaceae bacterium]
MTLPPYSEEHVPDSAGQPPGDDPEPASGLSSGNSEADRPETGPSLNLLSADGSHQPRATGHRQAERYLPDWTLRHFLVLDPSKRWAAPIALEVNSQLLDREGFQGRTPVFETLLLPKEVLLFSDQSSTAGIIIVLFGLEGDCLGLLRRLSRQARRPPILILASDSHRGLLPVLMEAGADTVLFEVRSDLQPAEWCLAVLTARPRPSDERGL